MGRVEIKNLILDPTKDLDELLIFLEHDFEEVIAGIFEALFLLEKLYEQNQGRVDYLIDLLVQLIDIKGIDELKLMNYFFIDYDNKIRELEIRERLKVNKPYQRMKVLMEKIEKNTYKESYDGKFKYLEYLIFQNRDKELIDNYVNQTSGVLDKRNEDNEDVFEVLIQYYLKLDEKNDKDINYYYEVVLIFLASKYGNAILKNKDYYFGVIRKSKLSYKNHVIQLIRLFHPDYQVSLDELEEQYGIKVEIPMPILLESYQYQMDNYDRKNFLYQDCLTIDGSGSKCLDDACYIEKNVDGTYTLYVHIIDVAAFIPYHSLLNEEARNRVKTLYLKDISLSLYPEYISNQLCSILPNNYRNVISYIVKLDSNFHVLENTFEIVLGKIQSKYRLTYEEADRLIKEDVNDRVHLQLKWLSSFADVRRKMNSKKEEYRQFENLMYLEKNHESLKIDYSNSANIIHESMVFVNYMIAKYFKDLSLPYIYRKLELPSNDYIEKQIYYIKQLDSKMLEDKEFMRRLRDGRIEALYSSSPIYHKGLRLECYSHSSSPARRYPDTYGQYLIHDFLVKNRLDDQNIYTWEYRTNELVRYINKREKELESFSGQYNYLAYRDYIKKARKK